MVIKRKDTHKNNLVYEVFLFKLCPLDCAFSATAVDFILILELLFVFGPDKKILSLYMCPRAFKEEPTLMDIYTFIFPSKSSKLKKNGQKYKLFKTRRLWVINHTNKTSLKLVLLKKTRQEEEIWAACDCLCLIWIIISGKLHALFVYPCIKFTGLNKSIFSVTLYNQKLLCSVCSVAFTKSTLAL